ncbi:MAG: hypothetical protein HYX69_22895 [Planctomycetia bacterium]|nr:hypothetical protein [Planctomycetia bacterium]
MTLKVRMGELPLADYEIARKRFLGEISEHALRVVRVLTSHYREAERLVDGYGTSRRSRTLDALQLSIAMDLHKHDRIDTSLSAPTRRFARSLPLNASRR